MNMLMAAGCLTVIKPMLSIIEWKRADLGIWIVHTRPQANLHGLSQTLFDESDPRPAAHPQFDMNHHMRPDNPSTVARYRPPHIVVKD